jgi:hypothetical protein
MAVTWGTAVKVEIAVVRALQQSALSLGRRCKDLLKCVK